MTADHIDNESFSTVDPALVISKAKDENVVGRFVRNDVISGSMLHGVHWSGNVVTNDKAKYSDHIHTFSLYKKYISYV